MALQFLCVSRHNRASQEWVGCHGAVRLALCSLTMYMIYTGNNLINTMWKISLLPTFFIYEMLARLTPYISQQQQWVPKTKIPHARDKNSAISIIYNYNTINYNYNEACKRLDKHPNQTKSVSTRTPINHLSLLACSRVKFDDRCGRLLTIDFKPL